MKDKKEERRGSWKSINKKGSEYGRDIRKASIGFFIIALIAAIIMLFEMFK